MKHFAILFLLLNLVGCASPGASIRAVPQTPPQNGMTRITVERSAEFMYMALSANVRVNGQGIGALSRGDIAAIDIPPGRTTVSVDTSSSPGTFSISFITQPNRNYFLAVSPRSDSFLPGAMFGLLGAAVDAAVNENAGLFQVVGKTENRTE